MTAGPEWELTVGPVGHGGFCVARHEGRVVVFSRRWRPGGELEVVVDDSGRVHVAEL